MPTQMRLIAPPPLGEFVYLDRGAGGEYGWLREARALLISGEKGEEKGHILLAAFIDRRPLRCTLQDEQCVKVPSAMCSEDVLAARALRSGVATLGCRLYVTMFPCYWCTLFFARTGITHLYYAYTRDEKSPPQGDLFRLETSEVEVVRVIV
jgi:deoxycytidylate deaminase